MELSEERHRNMHKNTSAFTGGCKKRREIAVQIRKKKRDDILDDKRKINMEHCSSFDNISVEDRQKLFKGTKEEVAILLNSYRDNLSGDIPSILEQLQSARILARICEIAVSCDDGCASLGKSLLVSIYNPNPQERKNLTSLTMGMRIINQGMRMPCKNVVDAIELLQSISLFVELGYVYRNIFFIEDIMDSSFMLYSQYATDNQVSESFIWLLSLLCRDLDRYPPPPEKLKSYLGILREGIHSENLDFKMGSLKILAVIASGGDFYTDEMEQYGITEDILNMVSVENNDFMVPIVSILCSIEEAREEIHAEIWRRGLLKTLISCMSSNLMAKEICYILYSLCEQKQEDAARDVIECGALLNIPAILEKMDYHTRREAVYFISSLLLSTRSDIHDQIINSNILRHLSDLLTVMDSDFLEELLTIFDVMLQHGQRITSEKRLAENPVAVAFEEFGGRARLDYLVQCEIGGVSSKAQYLIEEFLEVNDEQLYLM